ncbi:sulfite exporter TauE/SafE family protein [Algoriphagus pacificus]|uniref:Sulfite exporter TauE/SafE family protein n=1 Tax=Algoriphagus pacificus TaxID=2811234 RepID=A0ABS3CMG5_9BACT|nr:sulfite exporter TauE/SafE family protein [Algoriphagus pacificus]MBN7817920.1 sulfite exporter TauE/SafE family protein [Algoriphagus pacificus]
MIWTAFLLGFLGSFHCVGMCGPIALAVGGANKQRFLGNKVIYHIGRSLTYALLGLIVGSLGFSLALAGIQQGISIAMGVLILIMALSFKKSEKVSTIPVFSAFFCWIKRMLGQSLKSGRPSSYFLTGILNGLLPCGMVYMALVAAIGLQSPWLGAQYMFFFGIGTVPVLLMLMISGSILQFQKKLKLQSLIPYLGIVIGVLFIFRGLGLGIHGFSPELQVFNYGSQRVEITICR